MIAWSAGAPKCDGWTATVSWKAVKPYVCVYFCVRRGGGRAEPPYERVADGVDLLVVFDLKFCRSCEFMYVRGRTI